MSLAIGQQINSINVAENNYIPGHENKHDSNTALLQAGSQSGCQGSSVHVVSSKLQSAPTPLITPKSETDSNGQNSCSTTNRDTAAQYPSLHFLAAQGEAAKIKEEIDKGADINAVDKTGLTPLAWAAAHRQKATVSLLLQNGADATISSPNGESALAFGTCQGQLDIVEQLLDSGADPNVTTADGGSPLMFASYSGYPQMVKVLLEHGADLTATNNEGNTALSLAVGMGNKNVQRVIDDYLRSVLEKPINHE